jgi:hypothetical protein
MYVSVDVDLDEFNDDDIINYLENRGYMVINNQDERVELIESIYHKRRLGQDYQDHLDTLIYNVIGRIV